MIDRNLFFPSRFLKTPPAEVDDLPEHDLPDCLAKFLIRNLRFSRLAGEPFGFEDPTPIRGAVRHELSVAPSATDLK
jgi:hypothetical protein